MSNIITKAHPVLDMHSTGLRVVGAWLFAIVLILFSTVFVHVPYTREIQMVLAIPVLLFFGAPFWLFCSVCSTLSSRIIGWASGWNRMSIMGLPPSSSPFP